MRPINGNWTAKPGNFDTLHALDRFPGEGAYDLPKLAPEPGVPSWWMPYDDWRTANRKGKLPKRSGPSGVHFFMEDYRFEAIWNNPERTLGQIDTADFLLTPDFSAYTDWPKAMQIWNTYRNRWVGAYWQRAGKRVIPTVTWSDVDSHSYCFDGLPMNSTLAVSTVGMGTDQDVHELFAAGYRAMVERLKPSLVINYGESFPPALVGIAPLKLFQPWHIERLRPIDAAKSAPALPGKSTPPQLPAPKLGA